MVLSPPPAVNSVPPSRVKRTLVTWLEWPPYVLAFPPSAGARYRLTPP